MHTVQICANRKAKLRPMGMCIGLQVNIVQAKHWPAGVMRRNGMQ